jgi:hypothetical protein
MTQVANRAPLTAIQNSTISVRNALNEEGGARPPGDSVPPRVILVVKGQVGEV